MVYLERTCKMVVFLMSDHQKILRHTLHVPLFHATHPPGLQIDSLPGMASAGVTVVGFL